jgi:hypothetical protein
MKDRVTNPNLDKPVDRPLCEGNKFQACNMDALHCLDQDHTQAWSGITWDEVKTGKKSQFLADVPPDDQINSEYHE